MYIFWNLSVPGFIFGCYTEVMLVVLEHKILSYISSIYCIIQTVTTLMSMSKQGIFLSVIRMSVWSLFFSSEMQKSFTDCWTFKAHPSFHSKWIFYYSRYHHPIQMVMIIHKVLVRYAKNGWVGNDRHCNIFIEDHCWSSSEQPWPKLRETLKLYESFLSAKRQKSIQCLFS